jgi:hypothetical protein
MSLKRLLLVSLAAATVVFALAAAPSGASKPRAGCPTAFEQLTFDEALAVAHETGVPLSDEELLGLLATYDKNTDEVLCFRDFPDTPGIASYSVNIVDNTARATK